MADPRHKKGDFARLESKWYRGNVRPITLDWPQSLEWELLPEKTQEGYDLWAKGPARAYYDQSPMGKGWRVKVADDYFFYPEPYPFANINVLVNEEIERQCQIIEATQE